MERIRIGSGAGFSGDRLDPALTLMQKGDLDYIVFECLAERTIALAQRRLYQGTGPGYDPLLEYRMRQILPLMVRKKTRLLTNMGAASPVAASKRIMELAMELQAGPLRLATVVGDNVLQQVLRQPQLKLLETGKAVADLGDRILSANAYLGAGPLVKALEMGADLIMTGRVADPALFLAPMIQRFGWSFGDYDMLGKGTLVGHLLECAGQLCGGYFMDADRKAVPRPWDIGFPYAEVAADGSGYVSKVPGTGGLINTATCTEQLLYEIHDPTAYLTPDCTADFSQVQFVEVGPDKVEFDGARGLAPTETYKVSIGYRNGFMGEGQISYCGIDAVARARLAGDIIRKRLEMHGISGSDLRISCIGVDAVRPGQPWETGVPPEVRLRVCGKTGEPDHAALIGQEVEALYTNGPAGGGGGSKKVEEVISVASVLLPKNVVDVEVITETL